MDGGFLNFERNQQSNKKAILGLIAGLAVIGVVATVAVMSSRASISTEIVQMYELDEARFRVFMLEHGKTYESEEEYIERFAIFRQNVAYINAVNSQNKSYTLGINKFTDLTHEEFQRYYLTTIPKKSYEGVVFEEVNEDELADSVDWRSKGVVTPVKDQGQCGSCWAFSTTGALEGLHAISQGSLISFSEQQLVDCSKRNDGCNGGLMDLAFKYVSQAGIETESDYPYKGRDGQCKAGSGKSYESGIQYTDVEPGSESSLKSELAKGPVSVAVDANNWSYYSGGVFDDCRDSLDHGVLVVGYDEEAWIVKNSWGEDWGEKGYIRVKMGNTCGILNQASRPHE